MKIEACRTVSVKRIWEIYAKSGVIKDAEMKPEVKTKTRSQRQPRRKPNRVLEAIFMFLFCFAGGGAVFLMIGAFIFCGHASSRPLAQSAQTETEIKLWENLHILDDIIVSVRTKLRLPFGASIDGTPIKTIVLKSLPFLPLLFLGSLFHAIICTRESSKKDESTFQSIEDEYTHR